MGNVPITFEHQGKQFSGYFTVAAKGDEHTNWYLMGADKRYYRSLRLVVQDPIYIDNPKREKKPEKEAWYFGENDGSKGFAQFVDYFRDIVTARYV